MSFAPKKGTQRKDPLASKKQSVYQESPYSVENFGRSTQKPEIDPYEKLEFLEAKL